MTPTDALIAEYEAEYRRRTAPAPGWLVAAFCLMWFACGWLAAWIFR